MLAEEFVSREMPEFLSDTVGEARSFNRPSKIAWSAGKAGAY